MTRRKERQWLEAFQNAASDAGLLLAFIAAYQHRRQCNWLAEHQAQSDAEGLQQALATAVTMSLRPCSKQNPKFKTDTPQPSAPSHEKAFNEAAKRLIDAKGVEYLEGWLVNSSEKARDDFVSHIMRQYAIRFESGARTNEPW